MRLMKPQTDITRQAADQAPATTELALVSDGLKAFNLRTHTARNAVHTLDLQYYAWYDDITGRLVAREVLHAADRGVKVRLLLDYTSVLGDNAALAALQDHDNIDVKLFNVSLWRFAGRLGFALEFALGGWHLNHRMHNKTWVVDGKLAILGGRNIGDAYFDASGEFNFRDLDVVISGAEAVQATRLFDAYWNNRLSRPVLSFKKGRRQGGTLPRFRQRLDETLEAEDARPYLDRISQETSVEAEVHALVDPVTVDDMTILYDRPEKAVDGKTGSVVATAISGMMRAAQSEILLISPYFVPGRRGMALLRSLIRRGVRISVITNSLAATDVTAVHGGYERYRRRMLQAGIELRELRRSGHETKGLFGSSGASLHTKALCIDGHLVGVGSFNLDPRSANINTEMGVFTEHPELARQLRQEFDRLAAPQHSYCVELEGRRLVWRNDQGKVYHEPDAPLGRRIIATLSRWLPVESQL